VLLHRSAPLAIEERQNRVGGSIRPVGGGEDLVQVLGARTVAAVGE
jgi:hypothetical protein